MNATRCRLFVTVVAVLVSGGGPVLAQTPAAPSPPAPAADRRPYRGIFGGGAPDPTGERSLSANFSVFGAYDDNVVAGVTNNTGAGLDPRLQESGFYQGASAALTFRDRHSGARSSWGTAGTASIYGYRTDEWKSVPRFSGGIDGQWQLSRSLVLASGYDLTYSSNYRLLLFPDIYGEDSDGAIEGDPDTDVLSRHILRHAAVVSLNKTIDSRSNLSVSYRARYVHFTDDLPDLGSQAASIGYDRRLTRHATLNLGYAFRHVNTRFGGQQPNIQNINAGVSYSRALSISRRTSFSFSTGSSVVRNDPLDPTRDAQARFRMNGSAALTHEIGRSWTAFASYQRRFVFREAFAEPFSTDGVSVGVGGLITRKLEFSARAGWSLSAVGDGQRNQHKASVAVAQARYGLTRYLAAYARYVYYRYRIGEDVVFADDLDLPRSLDRNGVRVGITAFVPLIR